MYRIHRFHHALPVAWFLDHFVIMPGIHSHLTKKCFCLSSNTGILSLLTGVIDHKLISYNKEGWQQQ